MSGFPKLVQVLDSPRLGTIAVFEDGSIAAYNAVANAWRPFVAQLDYEALFCTTTRTYADLTLAPEVQVDD